MQCFKRIGKEDTEIQSRDKPSRNFAVKGSRKIDSHWRDLCYNCRNYRMLDKNNFAERKIVFLYSKGKLKTFKTLL